MRGHRKSRETGSGAGIIIAFVMLILVISAISAYLLLRDSGL